MCEIIDTVDENTINKDLSLIKKSKQPIRRNINRFKHKH